MAVDPNDSISRTPGDPADAQHPPHTMLRRDTRRRALMNYLGPVILLFVVVGIALIYWANRGHSLPTQASERDSGAVGTAGTSTEGGNPAPVFHRTRDEIDFRGNDGALTSVDQVERWKQAGRAVELHGVNIESVADGIVHIRQGQNRVAVVGAGTKGLEPGAQVNVSGQTELTGNETRVRASSIEAAK